MSRIADEYGLDVWVWYPALDKDYTTRGSVVKARGGVGSGAQAPAAPRRRCSSPAATPATPSRRRCSACSSGRPRTSASSTRRCRCGCRRRASPSRWMETFYGLMAKQPAWLTGIVIGPQNRDSLADRPQAHRPAVQASAATPTSRTAIRAEYPVPDLGRGVRADARPRADQPAAARSGRRSSSDGSAVSPSGSSPTPRAATTT